MAALLREFGVGAHGKHLPDWAHRLPRESALALVQGWTDGDGCAYKGGNRVASVSYPLLFGMQRLLARQGITSAVMQTGAKGGELRWRQPSKPYSMWCDERGLWVRVRSVEVDDYSGPAWELETQAGDALWENLLVHAGGIPQYKVA